MSTGAGDNRDVKCLDTVRRVASRLTRAKSLAEIREIVDENLIQEDSIAELDDAMQLKAVEGHEGTAPLCDIYKCLRKALEASARFKAVALRGSWPETLFLRVSKLVRLHLAEMRAGWPRESQTVAYGILTLRQIAARLADGLLPCWRSSFQLLDDLCSQSSHDDVLACAFLFGQELLHQVPATVWESDSTARSSFQHVVLSCLTTHMFIWEKTCKEAVSFLELALKVFFRYDFDAMNLLHDALRTSTLCFAELCGKVDCKLNSLPNVDLRQPNKAFTTPLQNVAFGAGSALVSPRVLPEKASKKRPRSAKTRSAALNDPDPQSRPTGTTAYGIVETAADPERALSKNIEDESILLELEKDKSLRVQRVFNADGTLNRDKTLVQQSGNPILRHLMGNFIGMKDIKTLFFQRKANVHTGKAKRPHVVIDTAQKRPKPGLSATPRTPSCSNTPSTTTTTPISIGQGKTTILANGCSPKDKIAAPVKRLVLIKSQDATTVPQKNLKLALRIWSMIVAFLSRVQLAVNRENQDPWVTFCFEQAFPFLMKQILPDAETAASYMLRIRLLAEGQSRLPGTTTEPLTKTLRQLQNVLEFACEQSLRPSFFYLRGMDCWSYILSAAKPPTLYDTLISPVLKRPQWLRMAISEDETYALWLCDLLFGPASSNRKGKEPDSRFKKIDALVTPVSPQSSSLLPLEHFHRSQSFSKATRSELLSVILELFQRDGKTLPDFVLKGIMRTCTLEGFVRNAPEKLKLLPMNCIRDMDFGDSNTEVGLEIFRVLGHDFVKKDHHRSLCVISAKIGAQGVARAVLPLQANIRNALLSLYIQYWAKAHLGSNLQVELLPALALICKSVFVTALELELSRNLDVIVQVLNTGMVAQISTALAPQLRAKVIELLLNTLAVDRSDTCMKMKAILAPLTQQDHRALWDAPDMHIDPLVLAAAKFPSFSRNYVKLKMESGGPQTRKFISSVFTNPPSENFWPFLFALRTDDSCPTLKSPSQELVVHETSNDSIDLQYPFRATLGGVTLRYCDRACLNTNQQLNDAVVYFYAKLLLLEKFVVVKNRTDADFAVFDPLFFASFSKDKNSTLGIPKQAHTKRIWAIPCNYKNHWSLCVVFHANVLFQSERSQVDPSPFAMILDSLSGKVHSVEQTAIVVKEFMRQYVKRQDKAWLSGRMTSHGASLDLEDLEFWAPPKGLPRQTNQVDCGLYVCKFIECLLSFCFCDGTFEMSTAEAYFKSKAPEEWFCSEDVEVRMRPNLRFIVTNKVRQYQEFKRLTGSRGQLSREDPTDLEAFLMHKNQEASQNWWLRASDQTSLTQDCQQFAAFLIRTHFEHLEKFPYPAEVAKLLTKTNYPNLEERVWVVRQFIAPSFASTHFHTPNTMQLLCEAALGYILSIVSTQDRKIFSRGLRTEWLKMLSCSEPLKLKAFLEQTFDHPDNELPQVSFRREQHAELESKPFSGATDNVDPSAEVTLDTDAILCEEERLWERGDLNGVRELLEQTCRLVKVEFNSKSVMGTTLP